MDPAAVRTEDAAVRAAAEGHLVAPSGTVVPRAALEARPLSRQQPVLVTPSPAR